MTITDVEVYSTAVVPSQPTTSGSTQRNRSVDTDTANLIKRVTQEQRAFYVVDTARWQSARVRTMTVYQVKGREMDDT